MLDKRSIALLNLINSKCDSSGYKIFSFDELLPLLPARLSLDGEGIKESLSHLSNHEFVSVKYQDESEVCLRPLIKGRVAVENIAEKTENEKFLKRSLFWFAFVGSLLGGIVSSILLYFLGAK